MYLPRLINLVCDRERQALSARAVTAGFATGTEP